MNEPIHDKYRSRPLEQFEVPVDPLSTLRFMREVEALFDTSLEMVLNNRGVVTGIHCEGFVIELLRNHSPTQIASRQGFIELRDKIQKDAVITDFLEDVAYQFYGRIGYEEDVIKKLAVIIGRAASHDSFESTDLNAINLTNVNLKGYLPIADEVCGIVAGNKWFLVCLLIQLFTVRSNKDIDDFNAARQKLEDARNSTTQTAG